MGSVGDSCDNALAEAVNNLYKTELVRGPDQGPGRTVDELELATLGWVSWFNDTPFHDILNHVPAAYEEALYAQLANTR